MKYLNWARRPVDCSADTSDPSSRTDTRAMYDVTGHDHWSDMVECDSGPTSEKKNS